MYEITIKIEKFADVDCSYKADYGSFTIDDEPIRCSNCCVELMENDGDKLCDLLEKGLCKKCDKLTTRLANSKNALEKKKQQIVNLEYKLYTAKHLKC